MLLQESIKLTKQEPAVCNPLSRGTSFSTAGVCRGVEPPDDCGIKDAWRLFGLAAGEGVEYFPCRAGHLSAAEREGLDPG